MKIDLGVLGNLEVYFVLPKNVDLYEKLISRLCLLHTQGVFKNDWSRGINTRFYTDNYMDCMNVLLVHEEEIVMEFFTQNNFLLLILLKNKMIFFVKTKPWNSLGEDTQNLSKFLLPSVEKIIMGYELDFDYHDIEKSLSEMKNKLSNHPFIVKTKHNDYTIFNTESSETNAILKQLEKSVNCLL